jgi:hypothetical protein
MVLPTHPPTHPPVSSGGQRSVLPNGSLRCFVDECDEEVFLFFDIVVTLSVVVVVALASNLFLLTHYIFFNSNMKK